VGKIYEVTDGAVTRYYHAGGQRIATRSDEWLTSQASYAADFGLLFYQARWYDPYITHFTSPDTIIPDPYQPAHWNKYTYTRDNPINFTDPTGHISEKQGRRADVITANLYAKYNVLILKDWGYNKAKFMTWPDWLIHLGILEPASNCQTWEEGYWRSIHEMEALEAGIKALAQGLGGEGKFRSAFKNYPILIRRYSKYTDLNGQIDAALATERNLGAYPVGDVIFFDATFSDDGFARAITVHELSHVWDARNDYKISWGLASLTNTLSWQCNNFALCTQAWDESNPIEKLPTDYHPNEKEYWAEVVMTYIYPDRGNLGPNAKKYIEERIKNIP
jgi:RHS repeat-associated protein